MASLRRSTVMPTDSATSRFLYTILKQLDHKFIDWNAVASDLEITNGHAARMRFSRFKQHMEGVPTNPRKPRSETRQPKKSKVEKSKAEKSTKRLDKRAKAEWAVVKPEHKDTLEPSPGPLGEVAETTFKPEPFIKPEPLTQPEPFVKPEPTVKDEPMDDWLYSDDPMGSTSIQSDYDSSPGSLSSTPYHTGVGSSVAGPSTTLELSESRKLKADPGSDIHLGVKPEPTDF